MAIGILSARANDLDFYTTVLCTAFAGGVGRDGAEFACAFSVDTVGRNAFAYQVVFDSGSTTLGQALVVFFRTDGVGVAGGDHGFKVDRLGLACYLVKDLAAFGLDGGLVEVEVRVGVQDNLGGCGFHDRRFGLCNRNAIAACDASSGCPEVIAPAKFVDAVHPDVTEGVLPVVYRWRSGSADGSHWCDGECKCDFGGFMHVSPRLSLMLVSDRSEPPPHIKKTEPV